MQTSELELVEDTEADCVMRWRVEELHRAGYGQREAVKLAMRVDIDLHRAVDLLRNGCPPSTALDPSLAAASRPAYTAGYAACHPFDSRSIKLVEWRVAGHEY